ncbi:MAG: hypothetical protein WDM87_08380 [Terracidiphilus sp.]
MKTAELAGNHAANPALGSASAPAAGTRAANPDLISALAGKQAGRDRVVAEKNPPRRHGFIRRHAGSKSRPSPHSRPSPWRPLLLALLAFGPLAWRVTDDLIGGEHISDIATQTSLWACILIPAVLAAFVVAAWSRARE